MSNNFSVTDFDDPYYLLGFDKDDLDVITDDEASLAELEIDDQLVEDEEIQQQGEDLKIIESAMENFTSNSMQQQVNKGYESQNSLHTSTPLHATTTVRKEKQTVFIVPEDRSTVEGLSLFSDILTSFTCNIICGQTVSYKVLSSSTYGPFDLEKLDVVLDENSTLNIQIHCTLNGLDVLEYPLWMTEALDEVMKKVKFVNITLPPSSIQEEQQQNNGHYYQFGVLRAFVTTPISYLLEKQAPHGILEKLSLHLDWRLRKGSKEFQLVWKRGFQHEAILRYAEDALFEVLIRRVFRRYPLIFSSPHVKRLAPIISHLPHITQSLDKIIRTARNTSSNNDFVQRIAERVKMIEKNTLIMRPHYSETCDNVDTTYSTNNAGSTATSLTLGMYYTISNSPKQQQEKSGPLRKFVPGKLAELEVQDPPDALEAIGKIWSITCSSAAPTLTEQ